MTGRSVPAWDDDDDRALIVPARPAPPDKGEVCTACERRISPAGVCGCNDR